MSNAALHPDALAAKYATLKHWRASKSSRRDSLGNWRVTRGGDGRLTVSAQLRGPDPVSALRAFMNRQAYFLSERIAPSTDRQLPQLDLTQPGRVAAFWRLSGVWVEIWHHDTGSAPVEPAQAVPVPSRRGLGGRLPNTRRKKESTTV